MPFDLRFYLDQFPAVYQSKFGRTYDLQELENCSLAISLDWEQANPCSQGLAVAFFRESFRAPTLHRGSCRGKPDWDKDHRAAEQFVRTCDYGTGRPSWGAYVQDDASVFEQKNIHGHSVRATLLCAGIAAAAWVNDEERYRETAIRLWESMVFHRMPITGGVGAFANEGKFVPD
jgi:hypothetical protein